MTYFVSFSANCYFSGKYYDHGASFSPRVCVTCTCNVSIVIVTVILL